MGPSAKQFRAELQGKSRGRMLDAQAIARECFSGTVSEKWVRIHVPGKITFSKRLVRWWERDVLDWIDTQRVQQ